MYVQGASKHHPNLQGVSKYTGSIQTYGWCPNIQEGVQTWGHPNMLGCPHILGHPNIQGGIQTYRGCVQTYGSSKHVGVSTHIGASKHIGCIQTYRGCVQTYGVHPNIQGVSKNMGASKCMDTPLVWQSMLSLCCVCTGGIQTSFKHTGGVQTYGEHPNIRAPKLTGGIQTYRRASKHMGGFQTYGWCWNI